MTSTVHGTNYFRRYIDAVYYYKAQCVCDHVADAQKIVDAKLADGQIHIGKPAILPGETLRIITSEGRYAIETPDNLIKNRRD